MSNILLTGGTGFLGMRLLERILEENKVYALVRPGSEEKLKCFGHGNLAVIQGNILQSGLGISEDLSDLNEVWHLAALTEFEEDKRENVINNNFGGTKNLIKFLQGLKRLKIFHFLSTAYVSGKRTGVIYENELIETEFRNAYEESKFLSEQAVIDSGLPYVIHRPIILMGDSKTGEAKSNKMVYGVFRGLYISRKLAERNRLPLNIRSIGLENSDHNLVAVNEAVDAMLGLNDEANIGKTFHLTNDTTATNRELYDVMAEVLNENDGDFEVCVELVGESEPENMNRAEILLNNHFLAPYKPYMIKNEPIFDKTNLHQALPGFEFTKLDYKLLFEKYLRRLKTQKL